VVYLVFNEGHTATEGDELVRPDLCDEAVRLARLAAELLPEEPEAAGLLALLLLTDARRAARTDGDGGVVTLDRQDRALWDAAKIAEGRRVLDAALARRRPGPYQIQAAISALHCEAARAGDTDWRQIVALYDALLVHEPSGVVALNRAVAVSMLPAPEGGPSAALALLDPLADDAALGGYGQFHVARADLLRRLGRGAESALAERRRAAVPRAPGGGLRDTRLSQVPPPVRPSTRVPGP
jgi:RNA polymerase sigma-70 factor (ECF subfamily)